MGGTVIVLLRWCQVNPPHWTWTRLLSLCQLPPPPPPLPPLFLLHHGNSGEDAEEEEEEEEEEQWEDHRHRDPWVEMVLPLKEDHPLPPLPDLHQGPQDNRPPGHHHHHHHHHSSSSSSNCLSLLPWRPPQPPQGPQGKGTRGSHSPGDSHSHHQPPLPLPRPPLSPALLIWHPPRLTRMPRNSCPSPCHHLPKARHRPSPRLLLLRLLLLRRPKQPARSRGTHSKRIPGIAGGQTRGDHRPSRLLRRMWHPGRTRISRLPLHLLPPDPSSSSSSSNSSSHRSSRGGGRFPCQRARVTS